MSSTPDSRAVPAPSPEAQTLAEPAGAARGLLPWILLALWCAWIAGLAVMACPYLGQPRLAPAEERAAPAQEPSKP